MLPALFTDLYELTMAQAYRAEGMDQTAVFELAYRKLPEHRNYIAAAGLADALRYLSQFREAASILSFANRAPGDKTLRHQSNRPATALDRRQSYCALSQAALRESTQRWRMQPGKSPFRRSGLYWRSDCLQ